jgi:glutamate 5-kinase
VLLTHADLADRERHQRPSTPTTQLGSASFRSLTKNDTVVNDQIKFGDNDTLGALVANLLDADLLVILTDQAGLFDADPRKVLNAKLVQRATAGDPELERMAGGAGSAIGRGGMLTKILAAKRAARSGASTIIASGREPEVLLRIVAGESLGTELVAATPKVVARKLWMSDHLQLRGSVTVDDGAATQVRARGKSLLPIGVVAVAGDFHRGDVIAVRLASGEEIGRGLSNYSSAEARLIARRPSADIERLLGFIGEPELIHRDNFVLS